MPLLRMGAWIITGRVSPTSFIGPLVSLAGIVALVGLLVTGRIDLSRFDDALLTSPSGDLLGGATTAPDLSSASPLDSEATMPLAPRQTTSSLPPVSGGVPVQQHGQQNLQQTVNRSPDRIRLGSIPWQAVRPIAGDPQWIKRLSKLIADFDVVAVQQVESRDYAAFQSLLSQLEQSGSRFELIASPELGRSGSRERLVYLWNVERIMLVPESSYSIGDDADRLEFEPYVSSFEVRSGVSYGRSPFRFSLMNVRSRSDAAAGQRQAEWNVLQEVAFRVCQFEWERRREDDLIVIGDFALQGAGLAPLVAAPQWTPVIQRANQGAVNNQLVANSRAQELLILNATTREFTGRCGAFNLLPSLGLPDSGATVGLLPVWAEFSAEEAGSGEL